MTWKRAPLYVIAAPIVALAWILLQVLEAADELLDFFNKQLTGR